MSQNKKKTFGQKLWEFFRGSNRNPTTSDIIKCLIQGSAARAKVRQLYKQQIRIENERKKFYTLYNSLKNYRKDSLEYKLILRKLSKLLNITLTP